MNLRDNVKSAQNKVAKEANALSEQMLALPVGEISRLALFEDIINLEIGDTSLMRAKSLERQFDIRQLYIKYEGNNPTGTQKDRIAFAQVYDALRRGYDRIVLATCGNYGVAVSLAANLAHLQCMVYIPAGYHTDRIAEMESLGAEIIRAEGTYEDVVRTSSEAALKNDWYDANPGGENTPIQINAYAQIAFEIYDDLRDAPKFCAVPVSNGTLFAGIYRGFVSLYKRGKTSRIPRMIAASSTHKNPIIHSFSKGFKTCVDLDPAKIKETSINEPLINWHSFDGEEALQALYESNGLAYHISDKAMKEMSALLLKVEGSKILPASTAGLIGLLKANEEFELEPDRFVAVLTARD
ncbi:pyridoxal-phosphate dependent enzyme [Portibacter lacus]|uniref:Threonine synthase n=1 Tax=Portibacter lacus TaxID=1099794 RepID=A0AA37WD75_9BACT|nr:pyridoxal-phosphate dependent enzyme [Portibacter lacus]GLR15597.1 threonine synthase [Portibacter lacus]